MNIRFNVDIYEYKDPVVVELYYGGFYVRTVLATRGLIRFKKHRLAPNSEKHAYYYGMTDPRNCPPAYRAIEAYKTLMLYKTDGRIGFYDLSDNFVSRIPTLERA